MDGINKEYYENGRLPSKTSYKNDKKDGVEKIYDKNGRVVQEINYKTGGAETDQ